MGCGVKLQTTQANEAGYIPQAALKNEILICQRCFRLKQYNELTPISMQDSHFINLLNSIGEQRGLVVYLVDLFDVNGSWLSGLQRFVGDNPILLVGNKIDLLPKNIRESKVIHWLKYMASEAGLKPIEVKVCSADSGQGIAELMETIESLRSNQNVFVVGTTNVGKSTFINKILDKLGVEKDLRLTTSRFPGTTLNMVQIPLEDDQFLCDTPGIMNRQQLAHFVSTEEYKVIMPQKRIKPMVYQLNEKQSLFFGGVGRLDFIAGASQAFVCYMSNQLYIHRTKLEKAEELYHKQLGELLVPPDSSSLENWPGLLTYSFKIPSAPTDIVFPGLGWVTLKGSGAQIVAHVPKGSAVILRKAFI
jgi:ribosome biogenesis GTPase YqeH